MRTLILIALLLASLILSAQDTIINELGGESLLDDGYYKDWTTIVNDSSVNNSCKANFYYVVNTEIMTLGFAPATALNFYDLSDGKAINWLWDFGDGNTSNEQNPLHIFNHPMTKPVTDAPPNPYRTVTLTILTTDSCKSTYSETIDIFNPVVDPDPRCKAEFKHYTLAYDSIGGTETFQFSNRSEGESISYLWQFDNGTFSTDIEPTITYDFSQPMHKVSLTITGTDGCTDTYGEDVFITYPGGGSSEPGDSTDNGCFVAFGYTINYDNPTFAAALVLDFYTKSDDEITSWFWDFDDGYIDTVQNPTHIFNYPIVTDSVLGDPNPFRKICLTVITASGCESRFCQTIDIYTGSEPFVKECHPWFKGYIPEDIFTIPEVIPFQFTDGSEGDVVSWLWQFEDGTYSTEREPLVMFDAFIPTQNVCLTITTSDSCTSTWCETIFVIPEVIDTFVWVDPICNYTFNYTSYYPEWASACIGTASAQVVLNDSAISTEYYYWTSENGEFITESQDVKNLCPTQTYTVTALTTDGCKFSGSFIFNSDGTITEIPVNWWRYGFSDDSWDDYIVNNTDFTAEWILCDGTVVTGDSIQLTDINCETNEPNFFLKDANGNVVYQETVSINDDLVANNTITNRTRISFYPVPVSEVLNFKYNGTPAASIRLEISDLTGKTLLKQEFCNVTNGQHFSVDFTAFQKGLYLGKIISDNKIIAVEKFSK